MENKTIELHISLSPRAKLFLETLSGMHLSENRRKRISWLLVLQTMNEYISRYQKPTVFATRQKKSKSTRKVTISQNAHPELFSYLDKLMKSQRTFEFDCILHSLEDAIEWQDDLTISFIDKNKGARFNTFKNVLDNSDIASQPRKIIKPKSSEDVEISQRPEHKDSSSEKKSIFTHRDLENNINDSHIDIALSPKQNMQPDRTPESNNLDNQEKNDDLAEFLDFMDF